MCVRDVYTEVIARSICPAHQQKKMFLLYWLVSESFAEFDNFNNKVCRIT